MNLLPGPGGRLERTPGGIHVSRIWRRNGQLRPGRDACPLRQTPTHRLHVPLGSEIRNHPRFRPIGPQLRARQSGLRHRASDCVYRQSRRRDNASVFRTRLHAPAGNQRDTERHQGRRLNPPRLRLRKIPDRRNHRVPRAGAGRPACRVRRRIRASPCRSCASGTGFRRDGRTRAGSAAPRNSAR